MSAFYYNQRFSRANKLANHEREINERHELKTRNEEIFLKCVGLNVFYHRKFLFVLIFFRNKIIL